MFEKKTMTGQDRKQLHRGSIAALILCCIVFAAAAGLLLYHSRLTDSLSAENQPAAASEQLLLAEKQGTDAKHGDADGENLSILREGMGASPVMLSSTRNQRTAQPVSLWSIVRRAVTRGSIHREYSMTDYYGCRYYDVVVNDRIGANDEEDTASITFKLDNNYTRLTGTLFRNDEHWTESGPYPFVRIYCDDYRVVFESLDAREGPYDFDIDLTGVKTLRIEFDCILSYGYAGALANCMITPKQNFTPPTMTSNPKTEFGKAFREYLDDGTSMKRSEKVDLILKNYNGRLYTQNGKKYLREGFSEVRENTGAMTIIYNYADGILYSVSIYESGSMSYFLSYWDGALIGVQDFFESYGQSWISPDDYMFPAFEALFSYIDPYSIG